MKKKPKEIKHGALVYVSAPFRAGSKRKVGTNIHRAVEAGRRVWKMGYTPIIVHSLIEAIWGIEEANTYDERVDFQICKFNYAVLEKCDAMLLMKGIISKGMAEEVTFCLKHGIPIIDENIPA